MKEALIYFTISVEDSVWMQIPDHIDTENANELQNYVEENFDKHEITELLKSAYIDGLYDNVAYSIAEIEEAEEF